ncbi:hypothetical protein [Streptosporangium vulgare]|uniref:DUF7873 family protein n=1 Tax=Streptosporangium vulgare TaxID=46190 RepID=UPI0031DE634C
MATKLNQILAVEKGVKSDTQRKVTDAYHTIQKNALLSGLSRTYQPIDDEGERLPPESTRVQVQGEDLLKQVGAALTRLFDVTATKDWANCTARADVKVDGSTLLEDVPVTYLLFWRSSWSTCTPFIAKLPVLGRRRGLDAGPVDRLLADRAGQDDPYQEGAPQPRQGGGHRQAPGPGRGLPRGHRRRLLDQGHLLRGRAAEAGSTSSWSGSAGFRTR